MITEQICIELNGKEFELRIDWGEKRGSDAWHWVEKGLKRHLNQSELTGLNFLFLEHHAHKIYSQLDSAYIEFFRDILQKMGPTSRQLIKIGAIELLGPDADSLIIEDRFKDLPEPCWTVVNNFELAGIYFDQPNLKAFDYAVRFIGDGPMVGDHICGGLLASGIITYAGDEDFCQCIVVGRSGWSESEIDEIIDNSVGGCLRFYSQEMFLSILMGLPDPFEQFDNETRLVTLLAFKAGHPGLTYVAKGWPGWINSFTIPNWRTDCPDTTLDTLAMESPLHALGYKVGRSGIARDARRRILSTAFLGPLPPVQNPGYMEEWGAPNTGKRLKRIANHLNSLILRNLERSDRDSIKDAINDWEEDLDWLKDRYYNGARKFDWPNATY